MNPLLNKLPIGLQTFSEIRKNDCLYMDKTEYIYQLVSGSPESYFLNRPRRFGKSLLISTLKAYFQGQRDLFRGLAIERLEQEWVEYLGDAIAGFYALLLLLAGKSLILQESIDKIA